VRLSFPSLSFILYASVWPTVPSQHFERFASVVWPRLFSFSLSPTCDPSRQSIQTVVCRSLPDCILCR
jgi:hypothetical protein